MTAFDITRMSSSSGFILAQRAADDGKRAGSATEPNNSSASEAARERLTSSSLVSSASYSTAFATTPFEICSFRGSVDRRRMAAGDDRVCELGLRGSIRLLEAFQRRIPASAKSQGRMEFVAEEKKSELRWLEQLII